MTFKFILCLTLSITLVNCRIPNKLIFADDYRNILEFENDTKLLQYALSNLGEGDELHLSSRIYWVSSFEVFKKVNIIGNGAVIKGIHCQEKNVAISFYKNSILKGTTFDAVHIAFKTSSFNHGRISKCHFWNQTYTAISIMEGVENVEIAKCTFRGKATGLIGDASYPCVQITRGCRNIIFTKNTCYNVTAGITADGMDMLLDNIIVTKNNFNNLTYYALKTDVGNNFTFRENKVSNSLYGVFYEALDEDVQYTNKSGNGVKVSENRFYNVERCLYIAGKNKYTEVEFDKNKLTNCKYGVNRSCGKLLITDNKFTGGTSLYHYFDALTEGNIVISGNVISNTINSVSSEKDWDKQEVEGSVVFSCGQMMGLGNVWVENNTFKNWEGTAICVPRIANSYLNVNVSRNTFVPRKKSTSVLKIGASQVVEICDNLMKANYSIVQDQILIINNTNRVSYPPNSGPTSSFTYEGNSWQTENTKSNN